MERASGGRAFSLGLRWLAAHDAPRSAVRDWRAFLAGAESMPEPRRLRLARLWPLLALLNGPLALTALMLWPQRSGVHLLLFLLVFVFVPLVLLAWTALSALVLGRGPWWRLLLSHHDDRVIGLWCARQALLNQGLFCIAGLAWLWLALLTRQVIFYWSTSVTAVSESVATLFGALSLGLLNVPSAAAVRAAEAGAITGWQGAVLADSHQWALWLSQMVGLWVLLPWVILLALCQWCLAQRIARWPDHNQHLRLLFAQAREPDVRYRALQPEQPLVEPAGHDFPLVTTLAPEPGFRWRLPTAGASGEDVTLGADDQRSDEARIRAAARQLQRWYVAGHAVPTGDLADLLHLHCASGGEPQLVILLNEGQEDEARLDALRHTWGVFLERNRLPLTLQLLSRGGGLDA